MYIKEYIYHLYHFAGRSFLIIVDFLCLLRPQCVAESEASHLLPDVVLSSVDAVTSPRLHLQLFLEYSLPVVHNYKVKAVMRLFRHLLPNRTTTL